MFAGSKKCTRDGFACCHPERSEGSPPSQPKDNVPNLVIAKRTLPDVAISFAQCVMLRCAKHLLAGRLRGDSSLHSEWQRKVPLLIANYSLLIILDSHIATLLGMTARSAKNWAVVLLSRRPSHNGHKQLLTFYTIKSLSLYLPSGRAHIALRLLRWVKIRLLLTF